MERYARFVTSHPIAVIVAVACITALAASQLAYLHLEIRRRAQLPDHHPYVQVQNRIADLFGGETTIVIGIVPVRGDIFNPTVLAKIQRVTQDLEELQGVVPGSVLSIAARRVKAIRNTADGISVLPFFEGGVPQSAEDIDRLRRELHDSLFSRFLVGVDDKAAAIVVDFDDTLTDREVHSAVKGVISSIEDDETTIALGGAPLVRAYIAEYTRQMGYLFLVAVIVIGLIHYEAFRTVQAMLLPLVTALLSVVWALGFLGFWRQPLDTWSALTPVVILAVAAGHAVQILKRYYEEYSHGQSSADAVVRSMVAVGPVMLTAGFIASAGFASLATFGVASVRVFGICLAAGILSALVIEMTFIPACRVLLPAPRAAEARRERGGRFLAPLLTGLAQITTRRPAMVLGLAATVVCVSLGGALRLRVDNSFHSWFPPDSRLRVDDRLLNSRLAGTSTLYVLFEGRQDGDLANPAVLRAIGDVESWLTTQPQIGAAVSLFDFVERIHSAMSGGEGIPDNRSLIAQYLFLYSMSGPDDLGSFVDSNRRNAVLRAYARTDEAEFGSRIIPALDEMARARFNGLPVTARVAGGALGVQTALNEVVVHEKAVNLLQVGFAILVLSSLALRSIVGGLLVIAPLAVAVAVNLGTMGYTRTWLSAGTSTVTAMAVSIGADFAIYLIFRVREEVRRGAELADALRNSLDSAGAAICFVASAVVMGYLALSLSGFRLWVQLGVLTAIMISVSALAALAIIPSIIMLTRPRFLSAQEGTLPRRPAAPGAPKVR